VDTEKRNEHEQAAYRYLEKVANSYILDASSGIYEPKPNTADSSAEHNSSGSNESRPFWVNVVRDWPVFLVSVGTLLLLIATVHYSRKQWAEANRSASANEKSAQDALDTLNQIKDQTSIMRSEMIGTRGAVLQFVPNLGVLASVEDGPTFISTIRILPGRVAAKNIALRLTVQRIILPSKAAINNPVTCNIDASQLVSLDLAQGMNGISKVCELPGFDVRSADEVMFTRQSVKISGNLTYENGFGDRDTQQICQIYLGYRYKGEDKGQNGSTQLVSGGDESFHDCEDFDRILHRAMRFKNRYHESYIPDRP
jgi:hypothetical protein